MHFFDTARKQKNILPIYEKCKCKKYSRKQQILANYGAFSIRETKSREKITLIENEKLISDNDEVANCQNNVFSNLVKNIEVPKYEVMESFHQNIESPALKAILK